MNNPTTEKRIPLAEFADKLRGNPTPAERSVRSHLESIGFRFQVVTGRFVCDFVCEDPAVIVEIDGPSHLNNAQSDHFREQGLAGLGFHILRFSNEDALSTPGKVAGIAGAYCRFLAEVSAHSLPSFSLRSVWKFSRSEARLSINQQRRAAMLLADEKRTAARRKAKQG